MHTTHTHTHTHTIQYSELESEVKKSIYTCIYKEIYFSQNKRIEPLLKAIQILCVSEKEHTNIPVTRG